MKPLHLLLTATMALALLACGGKKSDNDREETEEETEYVADAKIKFYLVADNDSAFAVIQDLSEAYPQLSDLLQYNINSRDFEVADSDKAAVDEILRQPEARRILGPDRTVSWLLDSFNLQDHDVYTFFLLLRPEIFTPTETIDIRFSNYDTGLSCYESIDMCFGDSDAETWAKVTRDNIGRQIAIVVDGEVTSAPIVQSEITGGVAQITGHDMKKLFDRIAREK